VLAPLRAGTLVIHGAYDGNEVSIYVDGRPAASPPRAVSGPIGGAEVGDQPVIFGRAGNDHTSITIHAARIYRRGLTAAEVADRYARVIAADSPAGPSMSP
jgi:Concanavalin A-like lectin/glucanases superfamily